MSPGPCGLPLPGTPMRGTRGAARTTAVSSQRHSAHLPLESSTAMEKWVFLNLQRGKVESPFFFPLALRDYLETVISRAFSGKVPSCMMQDVTPWTVPTGEGTPCTHAALGTPALKRAKRGRHGSPRMSLALGHFRREQEPWDTQTPTGSCSARCPSTWDSPSPVSGLRFPLFASCLAGLWG